MVKKSTTGTKKKTGTAAGKRKTPRKNTKRNASTLKVARIRNTQIKKSDVAYPQGEVYQDVIVPSTTDADKPISAAAFTRRVNEVKRFFSDMFGGYTSTQTVGGWVSDGKIIREKGMKVASFSAKASWTPANQRKVIQFLRQKAKSWKQEAIAYTVEDDIFYLKPAP
jgi:hypothetical protein